MQIKVGTMTTENELISEIAKYDLWYAFLYIGNESIKEIDNDNKQSNSMISLWTLSRVAYFFVKYGSYFGKIKIDTNSLSQINNLIINLYEPFKQDNNLWRFLNRMAREQFPSQYGCGEQIARYYWVFTKTEALKKINEEFAEQNKFDLQTYYKFFFYVLGNRIKMKSSHFEYQSLYDYCSQWQSQYDFLEIQKIEGFFGFISNDLNNLKEKEKELNNGLDLKYLRYEMSPLDIYPVINQFLGTKRCFIPSFESLQIKMSTGLYYYFQNLYNLGSKNNAFLTKMGEAFEEYIGWLLKKYFEDPSVKKVSEEIETKNDEHADWVLFLDDEIFIFECKARLLSLRGRQTYDNKTIKSFIEATVVKGCNQLKSTEEQLKTKYPNINITKIFVILDDFPFQKNSFEGLLENINVEKTTFDDVILTTARGIERLCAVLEEKTMKEICALKKSTEEYQKMDFVDFLHKISGKEKLENKYLQEIIDEMTK